MKLEINPREFWSAVACHRFESGDMSPRSKGAFTLVEMLVVVAIIVVLLALLVPAMDKAIYQAELARCASDMKNAAAGAMVYAAASQHLYPARPPGATPSAIVLRSGSWDYRPTLRSFVRINNAFNELLAPKQVDLEANAAQTISTSRIPWFGYQYASEKGMRRIGDRWTDRLGGVGERLSFSLLLSDLMSYGDGTIYTGHGDHEGFMRAEIFDDETYLDEYGASGAGGFALTAGTRYTVSRWIGAQRDTDPILHFDTNFAYDDGSAITLKDVVLKQNADDRLAKVRLYANDNVLTRWFYVPAESR